MTYTVQTTIKFDESCLAEAREWAEDCGFKYDNDNDGIAQLLFDWAYPMDKNEKYEIEESELIGPSCHREKNIGQGRIVHCRLPKGHEGKHGRGIYRW